MFKVVLLTISLTSDASKILENSICASGSLNDFKTGLVINEVSERIMIEVGRFIFRDSINELFKVIMRTIIIIYDIGYLRKNYDESLFK